MDNECVMDPEMDMDGKPKGQLLTQKSCVTLSIQSYTSYSLTFSILTLQYDCSRLICYKMIMWGGSTFLSSSSNKECAQQFVSSETWMIK